MYAELPTLRVVFASVLDTSITATNKTDNSGVRILTSYLERKVMVNEDWPGFALFGTVRSHSIRALAPAMIAAPDWEEAMVPSGVGRLEVMCTV